MLLSIMGALPSKFPLLEMISSSDRFGIFSVATLEYWWTQKKAYCYATTLLMSAMQLSELTDVTTLNALTESTVSEFTAIDGNQYSGYDGVVQLGVVNSGIPGNSGFTGYLTYNITPRQLPTQGTLEGNHISSYCRVFQRYVDGAKSGNQITITFSI